TPELRSISDYKFVGQPIPRIDLDAKVFGDPIFGMDVEIPGMLHAALIRREHVGATLASAETTDAEKMPGVVKVVTKDDWVAVVANSVPEALAAKRKIKVEWNIPRKWTEQDIRDLLAVGKGDRMITQVQGAALPVNGKDVVSMEFTSPLGAHAQIEPNGAVASVKDGKATIILSTQVIGVTQKQVAEALGFPLENVNVIPTYLGGGFGRRLNTSHAIQAAQLSQEVGKPVKYFFTRKEEFQHDTFRPPTHHVMRGKLGTDGLLESLEHHYASGDVAIGSVIFPGAIHTVLGTDVGAMRGGNIQYNLVPNHRAVQWHTALPFATSWWRSLGLLANTFAIESFVDEMAIKAGKDPIEFRLDQISDEGNSKRLKDVIRTAAEKSGYSDEVVNGRAMGFAASIDAGSPCAHAVEVSVDGNRIKVHKVTCVLDCGFAVNPDQVRAQCEGNIIMGMSAAMHERMTLKDGRLYPTIYGPYDISLMKHAPHQIDVHLIQGVDHPMPVGEPPMGPIGAAVANAVRRLTGKRLTDLPLEL
ncbi:MAG: molybdopterin cofactor-binding domain-containing protein, partial [Planctomycetota bacterium]